jgi:hypothetical protein
VQRGRLPESSSGSREIRGDRRSKLTAGVDTDPASLVVVSGQRLGELERGSSLRQQTTHASAAGSPRDRGAPLRHPPKFLYILKATNGADITRGIHRSPATAETDRREPGRSREPDRPVREPGGGQHFDGNVCFGPGPYQRMGCWIARHPNGVRLAGIQPWFPIPRRCWQVFPARELIQQMGESRYQLGGGAKAPRSRSR